MEPENRSQEPTPKSETKSRGKAIARASLEHSAEWRELPVSPKEFFEKYLNEPCYPEQQAFIDKILGTDPLKWDCSYQEGIALVGKGGGKDRTIAKLLVYLCYKILCLNNPQEFFENASIDIINISMNAKMAKKVFFKYFVSFIKKCRIPAGPGTNVLDRKNWFVLQGLDLKKDVLDREVTFPRGVACHSLDSTDYSFEGLNVLVAIFDEVGGFIPDKAREIYDAVTDTQTSRYNVKRKTILLSFPRDPNDFMMTRFKEAELEPSTYRVRGSTWEWNPKKKKEDFKEQYSKNPERARRVYECLCEQGEGGYFKYKEQLQFILGGQNRENPIVGDYVIVKSLKMLQFKPTFVPDPSAKYFIHVDTAKGKEGGDAAGLCMAHYMPNMLTKLSGEHVKKLKDLEGIDLSSFQEKNSLGVKIDLYFQIRAPKGGEIIFDDILEFVLNLKRGLKFNVKKTTFDGYQSLSLIQNLKKYGIESEELSVDKSTEPYDSLKSVIYRGVVDTYPNFVALRELEELMVNDRGKIDHPTESFRRSSEEGDKKGSKDVADAMAGAVHSCLSDIPPELRLWFSQSSAPTSSSTQQEVQTKEAERLVRYGERPRG